MVSRGDSRVFAVDDFQQFLKETETSGLKKSRHNNLMLSGNLGFPKRSSTIGDRAPVGGNIIRTDSLTSSTEKNKSSPRKSWNSLSILVRSVIMMQSAKVKSLSNVEAIHSEITEYKVRGNITLVKSGKVELERDDFIKDALESAKKIQLFCECAIIGSDKHIRLMQEFLEKDPKRNLLEKNDADHLLNKRNSFKQNAIYLAAKNGHLQVVNFLLKQDANPNIESSPDGKGTAWEKPLHVATRWGHIHVVKCLLEKTSYSKADLKKAIKNAEKPLIKEEILNHYSERYGSRPLLFLLCGCA